MVQVVHTVKEIHQIRKDLGKQEKTVGLVPTMGALHEGHLSLIDLARLKSNTVIVSIFVNPSQFAPTEDLDKYPRTLENDKLLIENHIKSNKLNHTNDIIIFAPNVEEIYPSGIPLNIEEQQGVFVNVLGKSHQLEGEIRPTFFRGVATIVCKLFNIVYPNYAFFGQKDAQQCVVIKQLVKDLLYPIEIVLGEIIREDNGLAKSSRNRYLNSNERSIASILYKALNETSILYNNGSLKTGNQLRDNVIKTISNEPSIKIDYITVSNPSTLQDINDEINPNIGALISGAVRIGNTRIIDNIILGIDLQSFGN